MHLPEPHRSLVPPSGWLGTGEVQDQEKPLRLLLLATVLGGFLRMFQLDGQSLWVDEMLTWQALRPAGIHGFWEQFNDTIQGPLYLAVLWPLTALRESDFMLRLPAALAGVAAIPVFGVVAHRLAGRQAAGLALLLFALNPFHIWYSQEARGYAFLILFSLAAILVFLDMIDRRPRPGMAILFGLLGAAAVLSNLAGIFLVASLGLGLLVLHRPSSGRDWGLWMLAFVVVLVLSMPWLLRSAGIWAFERVVPGSGTGEALRGETTFSPLALPYTLHTFFYGYSLGPSLRELHAPDRLSVLRGSLPLLLAGALPVAVGGVAGLWRLRRPSGQILIWIIVPIGILVLLALRNVKPWNPRYAAMIFPLVLLVVCMGLVRLRRPWGFVLSFLLTGLTIWSLVGYFSDSRYAKADLRGAARSVMEANRQGDPVLVPVVTSVFEYYYGGTGEILHTYGLPPLAAAAQASAFCDSVLAGRESCWLVLAREWYFDPAGLLPTAMARKGHLRAIDEMSGVRIYFWSRRS